MASCHLKFYKQSHNCTAPPKPQFIIHLWLGLQFYLWPRARLSSSHAPLTMAASKVPRSSTQNERELESAASSDLTEKSAQPSVGLHPAFYIAYDLSLRDSTKADANVRAGYGSR